MTAGHGFRSLPLGRSFGEGNAANYLTISAIGRVAKQPELKFCAVALEKVPATAKAMALRHSDRGRRTIAADLSMRATQRPLANC